MTIYLLYSNLKILILSQLYIFMFTNSIVIKMLIKIINLPRKATIFRNLTLKNMVNSR